MSNTCIYGEHFTTGVDIKTMFSHATVVQFLLFEDASGINLTCICLLHSLARSVKLGGKAGTFE